ncbi:MAG: winged helix-turn-helix domain-containing protein [Thermoguttaceae bacterium]|jgi:hypothetical protein
MSEEEVGSLVMQIGTTAGLVWTVLADSGALSVAKLVRSVDQPRDSVMQAVGWLAREDKIDIFDKGRTRMVALRP